VPKNSQQTATMPNSRKFMLGPPLLIAVLFSFGFIMMQPHHKTPVSSTALNHSVVQVTEPKLTVRPPGQASAAPLANSKGADPATSVPVTSSPQTTSQSPTLQPAKDNQSTAPAGQSSQNNKNLLNPVNDLLDNLTAPLGH
jgi:hypothetical protein